MPGEVTVTPVYDAGARTLSALALIVGGGANAQTAPAPVRDGEVEAIVVTGSRLQASGFSAPTPVTMVGAAQIEQRADEHVAADAAEAIKVAGFHGMLTGGRASWVIGFDNSFSMRDLWAFHMTSGATLKRRSRPVRSSSRCRNSPTRRASPRSIS